MFALSGYCGYPFDHCYAEWVRILQYLACLTLIQAILKLSGLFLEVVGETSYCQTLAKLNPMEMLLGLLSSAHIV